MLNIEDRKLLEEEIIKIHTARWEIAKDQDFAHLIDAQLCTGLIVVDIKDVADIEASLRDDNVMVRLNYVADNVIHIRW